MSVPPRLTRYSTREIVADSQRLAAPKFGHNPSWIKAFEVDRLLAERDEEIKNLREGVNDEGFTNAERCCGHVKRYMRSQMEAAIARAEIAEQETRALREALERVQQLEQQWRETAGKWHELASQCVDPQSGRHFKIAANEKLLCAQDLAIAASPGAQKET